MLNPRVVNQNVDLRVTKLRACKSHHGFNLSGLSHIRAVIGDLATQRCDAGFGGIDVGWRTKAIEHDVRACACQGLRYAKANAAGRACDEGGFVLKIF